MKMKTELRQHETEHSRLKILNSGKFSPLAPSIGQDNFRFVATEPQKEPKYAISKLDLVICFSQYFSNLAQLFKKFSL